MNPTGLGVERTARGDYDPALGIWCWADPPGATAGPGLFLDRDGVLVEEVNYLCRAADTVFIDGSVEAVAAANRAGVPVVVVTNQAGIGRGYYDWDGFCEVEEAIESALARAGAILNGVFACPFHASGREPYQHPAHPARKPRPGLLFEAARRLNLDLTRSWIIGDKTSDLEAGAAAGLAGGVHVRTGHGREHRRRIESYPWPGGFEILLAESIATACHALWPRLTKAV
jgi:D-glycero-D-manno-heptose 1,7-bisphosphate phosphatase